MAPAIGTVLRQARQVRELTAIEAARSAGISPAYLSKLENGAVKRPSPHVLHQLSETLAIPYADLMRASGYRVPGEASGKKSTQSVGSALFDDLSDDEREELLEYLAWYRARRRSRRGAAAADGAVRAAR